MSNTAFKRDIGDPQTIQNFVERVQSPERLKLLLVLTAADIRAVGPKVWNGWKAALLRELYYSALDVMTGGLVGRGRATPASPRRRRRRAPCCPISATRISPPSPSRGYPFYWLSLDAETHARHARLMREAEASGAPLTVQKRVDTARAVTEITLYTADHPGLFSRIAGALAVSRRQHRRCQDHDDVERHGARHAVGAGPGRHPVRPPGQAGQAGLRLRERADRRAEAAYRARQAARLPEPHQRLHGAAARPDRQPGQRLAYGDRGQRPRPARPVVGADARIDPAVSLQVSSAKISTYGEKVVDVFYVKNLFGHKVEHPQKLAEIRTALEAVLAKGNIATPISAVPNRRKRDAVAAE